MKNLQTITTLLIDGDGVLWRLKEPMPGLSRFFDVLEQQGINWALLTNNATLTISQYQEKLEGFGIPASKDQIFSSASVTALTMQERYAPGSAFYVIGSSGLVETLTEAGFVVHNRNTRPDAEVSAVIVGMDININYYKLATATLLIRNGAAFIGTNPDRTFPAPEGILPGAGSLLAALHAATDIEPEVIGKPEKSIFEAALNHFKAAPETTAMLGDRMETDILGAQQLGIGTILVLTGVTQTDDLPRFDYAPDVVLDDISVLADELEKTTS